jgi:hypothetical protein
MDLDTCFMNDASFLQWPFQGYSEESLRHLNGVSREWEPNGVFQHLQYSGFLLSKMR